MTDPLRNHVPASGRLIGTVLTLPGVTSAELLAEPFDLVWVDLEHGALGPRDAQEMVIGIQAAGASALVRVPADAHSLITAVLDAGADGVVIADVAEPGAVERVVDWIAHPPTGSRGWGPRRLALRGRGHNLHRKPSLWIQIESEGGVKRASEIAAVPEVDFLCVGTADLSFSLGEALDMNGQRLSENIATVGQAARAAEVGFGIAGALEELPEEMLRSADALVHSTDAKLCAQAADSAALWLHGLLGHDQETQER